MNLNLSADEKNDLNQYLLSLTFGESNERPDPVSESPHGCRTI
jgi:hypothetical protein